MRGDVLDLPEIVDDLTRRQFLGGLIALGVLGGCGRDTESASAPTASVKLTHDGGDVTLPRVPKRIVTLGEEVTEFAAVLGVQPVGVGSARVDSALGDKVFDGYYLTPAQIGTPRYVGPGPFNLEAIAAVRPDLIVHSYQDDQITQLDDIAPTVLFEFYGTKGSWQESLRRLGAGLGREPQAAAAIAAYEGAVASGRSELSDLISRAGRVSIVYPNYQGRGANYVYAAEHSVSRPVADVGFTVTGIEKIAKVELDGYAEISTELLGDLETDTILTLGPVDWKETSAAVVLGGVDIPVVWVPSPSTQPTTGPITALDRLNGYVAGLAGRG